MCRDGHVTHTDCCLQPDERIPTVTQHSHDTPLHVTDTTATQAAMKQK